MLGLDMLDVAIGLALVYFVFSLAVTAAKEALEAGLKYRARYLEQGIRELLDDPTGNKFAAAFYDHPLIYSLYRGGAAGTKPVMPSYIPARNFALAMLDLVGDDGTPVPPHQAPSARVKRAVEIAIRAGGNDPDRVRAELEAWFDSSMDRVSGWYKRRTQIVVLLLALIMSVAANVDTIAIFRTLQVDQDLRKVLVKKAEEKIATDAAAARASAPPASAVAGSPPLTGTTPTAGAPAAPSVTAPEASPKPVPPSSVRSDEPKQPLDELRDTSLPIGWSVGQQQKFAERLKENPLALAEIVIGWLLTAFAVMLGSPFWFDVLNRLMVIRSTVKPHEKSPEEASEDKQASSKGGAAAPPAVVVNLPKQAALVAAAEPGMGGSAATDGVGATSASVPASSVEDDADQHEDGCLCDHPIGQADETVDHDLPPATGGVAATR